MPGYQTKQECVAIPGAHDLHIQSLLDRQQYADPLGEAEALGIAPDGGLRVRDAGGERVVHSGEVSVRPAA